MIYKTNSTSDSVSVVLSCGDHIFMIRRNSKMKAFPGYHAFPGGKIEEFDLEETDKIAFPEDQHFWESRAPWEKIHWRTLAREVQEELGIDLYFLAKNEKIKNFIFLGEAQTPAFNPYRFKTSFYFIELGEKVEFILDAGEIEEGMWDRAENFYKSYRQGQTLLVNPTLSILKSLSALSQHQSQLLQLFPMDLNYYYNQSLEIPCIEPLFGVKQFLVPSQTIPPATSTNAYYFYNSLGEGVLVDPSPKSEEELKKLLYSTASLSISKIFITHHHRDHLQLANIFARKRKLPVLMSAETYTRSKNKYGSQYWQDLEVEIIKEGDLVGQWQDQNVFAYSIPGHDEGQLGLAPKNFAWFLVGDLIIGMGQGTVVIPDEGGDMAKYFSSLERVIAFNPQIILPSHGMMMRGIFRLQEALAHRKLREKQISELMNRGLSVQQILEVIYPDLDPRLSHLALQNIRAHLKKLSLGISNDEDLL